MLQKYSALQHTDVVTVATAARTRGIQVPQKIPAGQYAVGQTVPVVQRPGRPDELYLDRPDLERTAFSVYSRLLFIPLAPLIVFLGLSRT